MAKTTSEWERRLTKSDELALAMILKTLRRTLLAAGHQDPDRVLTEPWFFAGHWHPPLYRVEGDRWVPLEAGWRPFLDALVQQNETGNGKAGEYR